MKTTKVNISKRRKIVYELRLYCNNSDIYLTYIDGGWYKWEIDMKTNMTINFKNHITNIWKRFVL